MSKCKHKWIYDANKLAVNMGEWDAPLSKYYVLMHCENCGKAKMVAPPKDSSGGGENE